VHQHNTNEPGCQGGHIWGHLNLQVSAYFVENERKKDKLDDEDEKKQTGRRAANL